MGRTFFRTCVARAVPVLVVALLAAAGRAADWPRFRVAGTGGGKRPFVLLEGGELLTPGQTASCGVEVVTVSGDSAVLRWAGENRTFRVGEVGPSGAPRKKPFFANKRPSSTFRMSFPDWPEERFRKIGNAVARIASVVLVLCCFVSLFLFSRRRSGKTPISGLRSTSHPEQGPASEPPPTPIPSFGPEPPPRPRRSWWSAPSDEGFQEQEGRILAVLPEDTIGIRHQRILVRLENRKKVLLVHNIDLCPRIDGLERGREIRFYGQFTDNDRGGVFHRLHRNMNPFRPYVDGWIEYDGSRYS